MLARPDGRDHPRPWNKGLLVGQKKPLVCTENLNPDVVVMESAEDGARLYASGPLNRANSRRVFVQ
jgi:hypothetical protein